MLNRFERGFQRQQGCQRYKAELILSLHGLGEPHAAVAASERPFWLDAVTFKHLLEQIVDRGPDIEPGVVITFDDGNESDALLATPELIKHGLAGIFFVCAGRLGRKHYLDKHMIQDLVDGGMTIGTHGMYHRDWRILDASELDIEIRDARHQLEDVVQGAVNLVAIPFGSYDRRVLHRLMRDPWACIYTSDRGLARGGAKIKPRETLDTSILGNTDVISKLCAPPPAYVRLKRLLATLYKSSR
jgi:peptidoglycan/xylan/chitin deacetylase (PgdA/CDA1 family)